MVVWILMIAIASGVLAVAAAAAIGLPWWIMLLSYALVGALGGLVAGAALFACRSRVDSNTATAHR